MTALLVALMLASGPAGAARPSDAVATAPSLQSPASGPPSPAPSPQPPASVEERVAEIRVQGNFRTSAEEIQKLAAIQIGDPVTSETIALVQERLEQSGRFDEVSVVKRSRTIEATGDAVLVILLKEHPSGAAGIAGHLSRAFGRPMLLPILGYEDGYGFTYGARLSPPNLLGGGTHVSFPFTWGGTRRAAAEISRSFERGPITYVSSSVSISRRENPHFDQDDTRGAVSARVERTIGGVIRGGASASWTDVDFGSLGDRFTTWGVDIAFDTRRSADLPRNAVYVLAGWERLHFTGASIDRYRTDARGYVGLIGSTVLAVRVLRASASAALPPYEQYLLGGASSVRGFRTGYDAGDTMLAGSAELRVPLTSPINFGNAGVTVFIDRGAVYSAETRLRDAAFRTGVGGGFYFSAAAFRLNLDVARGIDRGFRVHLSTGFQF